MLLASKIASTFLAIMASALPFTFEETSWDFGTIREADGPVSHVFHYTNFSNQSVSMELATAGCSCTTVVYDRHALAPGKSSEVEVIFDPAGQTGQVHQTITLYSGNDTYRLTIEGVVAEREKDVDQAFPYALVKGLQVTSLNSRFGFVQQGTSLVKRVGIVNTSERDISLEYALAKADRAISVKAPQALKVGESGLVEVTFSPEAGRIGSMNNSLYLYPRGDGRAKGLSLEGYAVQTTKVEPGAPSFRFQPSMATFTGVKPGKTRKSEVVLYNDGKQNLRIIKVECPESVKINVKEGTEIRPGDKLKMGLSYKSADNKNPQQFTIKIFTNDPTRPMRELVCKISTK